MLELVGIISGILALAGEVPYIIDILHGKTKPERATWMIYMILASIAFFSQLAKGASNSLWLTGFETIGVFLIFLLSIKNGVGGMNRKDITILCFALSGLVLWYFTKEAAIALYIIIAVDLVGTIPTVIKSYGQPESETLLTWLLSSLAGILSMVAVGRLNLILLSYPFYIFLANGVVVGALFYGKRKRNK